MRFLGILISIFILIDWKSNWVECDLSMWIVSEIEDLEYYTSLTTQVLYEWCWSALIRIEVNLGICCYAKERYRTQKM